MEFIISDLKLSLKLTSQTVLVTLSKKRDMNVLKQTTGTLSGAKNNSLTNYTRKDCNRTKESIIFEITMNFVERTT